MIAFSACLGIGLFLQTGHIISLAGPGMAVITCILAGTVMWSMMACLGEMTALFPIQGPIFECKLSLPLSCIAADPPQSLVDSSTKVSAFPRPGWYGMWNHARLLITTKTVDLCQVCVVCHPRIRTAGGRSAMGLRIRYKIPRGRRISRYDFKLASRPELQPCGHRWNFSGRYWVAQLDAGAKIRPTGILLWCYQDVLRCGPGHV